MVTVAAPLAQALAAVHAAGLVHGDVSPANVLFTAEGMPLLTDLGVARLVGESGAVRGTAEYVEPGVARGGPPGPASDVWALGALCHHLLAGTPPHDGSSAGQVLAAAAAGGRAPLGLLAPAAPRALVAVVEAALSPDPAARPSAAALGVALQRAQTAVAVRLTGAPPVSAPVPPVRETHAVPRPPRPADEPALRRRSRALLGGGLALVLLLGGVLFWLHSGGGHGAQALARAQAQARADVEARARARAAASTASSSSASAVPSPSSSPSPTAAASPSTAAALPDRGLPPDWAAVLAGLDGLRGQAFAGGGAAALAQVYVPGSAVLAQDDAALSALTTARRTASGLQHSMRRVEQRAYTGDRATVRVVDVLGPQTVRDAAGAVVQTRPGRGEAAYEVDLVREGGGWRIAAIRSG